jgi:hypothetical protein
LLPGPTTAVSGAAGVESTGGCGLFGSFSSFIQE